jgi:hypothetical protein
LEFSEVSLRKDDQIFYKLTHSIYIISTHKTKDYYEKVKSKLQLKQKKQPPLLIKTNVDQTMRTLFLQEPLLSAKGRS